MAPRSSTPKGSARVIVITTSATMLFLKSVEPLFHFPEVSANMARKSSREPGASFASMTTLTTTNDKIKNPSHKHEEIMRWLLENPDGKLGDLAIHLGVTNTWLSIVIHSDLFQTKFAELRAEYMDRVLPGITEKLNGVAHAALDRLADSVDESLDPDFLLKVANTTLDKLGYGSNAGKAPGGQVVNNIQIGVASYEALQRAEALRAELRETKKVERIYAETERLAISGKCAERESGGESTEIHQTPYFERKVQEGD